jgi:hypothetical protein
MTDQVTLVLPLGQVTWSFPISHGTESFMPYRADPNDPDPNAPWLVDVPRHVAKHLLHIGGFTVAETNVHVLHSVGSIRLIHRSGPAGCSWQGMHFDPEDDGAVTVPLEALAELESHGFGAAPQGFGVQPVGAPAPDPEESILPAGLAAAVQAAQATDTTGHVWTPDPDGTAHPDGVDPAPPAAPPPTTTGNAAPAKKK